MMGKCTHLNLFFTPFFFVLVCVREHSKSSKETLMNFIMATLLHAQKGDYEVLITRTEASAAAATKAKLMMQHTQNK